MKRTGIVRTLRGQLTIAAGTTQAKLELILDDGRINVGYKIEFFRVWFPDAIGDAVGQTQGGCNAVLQLDVSSVRSMNSADNRQIAWSTFNTGSQFNGPYFTETIDPEHIVVRDMQITIPECTSQQILLGNSQTINYFIEMHEYDITDTEAIISIIKEESQDVDN